MLQLPSLHLLKCGWCGFEITEQDVMAAGGTADYRRCVAEQVEQVVRSWAATMMETWREQMQDESRMQAAVEHVGAYLALKAQIAGLEAEADDAKAAAVEALEADGEKPGKVWTFEGLGEVQIVKGRVSEKLDRAVLARGGVDPVLLDKATVRTEGKPSVRITAAKEGE